MMRLVRLRRPLLRGGALLVLLYLGLCIGLAPARGGTWIILPGWTEHVATVGLVLLVLSQRVAVAARQGWRRLPPLLALVPLLPVLVLVLALVSALTRRVEIDRVALPDGRVVMMTLEPVPTDTVYGLWERSGGWSWRELLRPGEEITYSEDGSFTADPRLLLISGGRHLLIRRGGLWTDCWAVAEGLRPCLPAQGGSPTIREFWLGRSGRIAAAIGVDPTAP